eukprot:2809930-Pleurochrysis_carterae.AAC.1
MTSCTRRCAQQGRVLACACARTGVVLLVVVDFLEAKELHLADARRRHEDVAAVVGVVEVLALERPARVGHARRVAPDSEKGGARHAARLG